MLMTEKEAAGVWCPEVRLPVKFEVKMTGQGQTIAIAASAVNVAAAGKLGGGITRISEETCCIATKCSQWLWERGEPVPSLEMEHIPREESKTGITLEAFLEVLGAERRANLESKGYLPEPDKLPLPGRHSFKPVFYLTFVRQQKSVERRGYCGKAGVPQA